VHLEAAACEGAIPHLCRMAVEGVAASANPAAVNAFQTAAAHSEATGGTHFAPVSGWECALVAFASPAELKMMHR
jgi:hypothetical protein